MTASSEVATPPEGFRSVLDGLTVVDKEPFVAILDERFGIPPHHFDDLVVFRPNRAWLSIVSRHLLVPVSPRFVGVGMPFFYPDLIHPRPTTATAIRFGRHARRNVVDLDRLAPDEHGASGIERFVHRQPIELDATARQQLDSPGYTLVRHLGLIGGLGHCKVVDGVWRLTGMAPRAWSTLGRLGDRKEPVETAP